MRKVQAGVPEGIVHMIKYSPTLLANGNSLVNIIDIIMKKEIQAKHPLELL